MRLRDMHEGLKNLAIKDILPKQVSKPIKPTDEEKSFLNGDNTYEIYDETKFT